MFVERFFLESILNFYGTDKKSNYFNHLRVFTVCISKVHGLLRAPKAALQLGPSPGSTDCNTDVHCRIPVNETRPGKGTSGWKANGWFCKS